MITKSQKHYNLCVIEKLIEIANELLATCHFNLVPGTYLARDIHQIFKNGDKNYIVTNLTKAEQWAEEKGSESDLRAYREITVEKDSFRIPRCNVFSALFHYEKETGISRKKAHRWIIQESREPVAKCTLIMPSEKVMMSHAKMARMFNIPWKQYGIMTLDDCNLRGLFTSYYYENGKKIDDYTGGYKISPLNRGFLEGYEDLMVNLTPDQLKFFYGTCKVSLYKNDNIFRPDMRIVIENEDGWSFSSADIREQYSKFKVNFDREFSTGDFKCDSITPEAPKSTPCNRSSAKRK